MITFRYYDEEERNDYIWYNSSNILFSMCEDTENELKTLIVVFKNGGTYKYKDVDVNDYVMFVHGGLDGSNGKALNKFIKPKCEFEKLENMNLEELEKKKELLLEKVNGTSTTTEEQKEKEED